MTTQTMTIPERVTTAINQMVEWSKELESGHESLVRALDWIAKHRNHARHHEQVNKYLELKTRIAEVEFWYWFCKEFQEIQYSVLTPRDGKEYIVTIDRKILELEPTTLLPQEFALILMKR